MSSVLPPIATRIDQVDGTKSIGGQDPEGTGDRPKPLALRLIKGNAGLIVAPLVIVLGAVALVVNYRRADRIFQDERALDWDRNLRPQLEQHLSITIWATFFTILIAVPLGILLTRAPSPRRVRPCRRSACWCWRSPGSAAVSGRRSGR